MKKISYRQFRLFKSRILWLLPLIVSCFGTLFSANAGSFTSDFNSGLPAGTAVYGVAAVTATGGFTNSGVLKLTTAVGSVVGSFVINDLDAGQPIQSFVAQFKVLVGGGTAADGFSFNFAPDLADGPFGESGAGTGTGITVSFDTYANVDQTAPAIRVFVGGGTYADVATPLRTGTSFVDCLVKLDPDGTLDVIYDGATVISNLFVGVPTTAGRFGLGARTGGAFDNHFIDNLNIVTKTTAAPFVESAAPTGSNVRPDAALNIVLRDQGGTVVDTNTIVLTLDGATIVPTITTDGSGGTTVFYQPPAIFAPSSTHAVSITFADNATPTPVTNSFQYGFVVPFYSALPPNLAVPLAYVDTNAPGFTVRFSQIENNDQPGNLARAEEQLAGLLIDASTSLPLPNIANPDSVSSAGNVVNTNATSYTYLETNVLNYASGGNFGNDFILPGLPGMTSDSHNYALDAVAYLHLTPGFYNLGVNSADGFELSVASTPDVFAPVQSALDGVRLTPADSTVSFSVSQEGYYPFRLLYLVGQRAGTGIFVPGTDTPSLEFFNVDAAGVKTLINDTAIVGYIPAYRGTLTLPYVQSVSPTVGETAVSRSAAIEIILVDGTITVQTNTIQLSLNGTSVTAATTISTNGSGGITVRYQPPALLAVNSTYTVQLSFTDSASNQRTNTYQFTTENILSQMWVIPPNSATNATWAKWLTTATSERGIAYNPKTGHVLIVSRSAAAGADGPTGLGIGVFDGNTGQYIKQLDKGTGIIVAPGGTFLVNLVDVADDGVIYVCSLATSSSPTLGSGRFKIYRWQNEDAQPTVAFEGVPSAAGGTPRWGDSFAVRGSGAGTQIIASGNNAGANSVPLFTTTDGLTFNVTLLVATGMPNSGARLGIAFGCGNTFYGKDNATTAFLRQVSFSGAPSTSANLTASYNIVDALGNQGIGPIGVDIVNQRLIGDTTIGGAVPHSMSLFDLDQLSTTAINSPIDSKSYATTTGSAGTGAVDFSPDGTRVYALDTGNGVIAFSLAPKLAAPVICAQPQTNFYLAGGLAFVDVGSSGHLPQYQWRKDGVPLAGATNRTLDISNFQVANAGFYSVIISNSLGSTTSSNALIDVTMVPVIQPANEVVSPGGSVTFSVTENGGKPSYTYQWKLNGNDIASATNTSLAVTNAAVANAGSYTVTVTDSLGQVVTSPAAFLTVGTVGSGTGLTGDYYSSQDKTFTSPPTLTRVDPTVDFDWAAGSPDGSIGVDTFTARWIGQVQPFYSQTYTFYTVTDDGVRLWVNGQLLIDKWIGQPPTEWSGTIALNANQKYSILMEYFEGAVTAGAHLSWGSANQPKQIIPMTQLYPGVSGGTSLLTSSLTGGNVVINWEGTYILQSSTNVAGPYQDVTAAGISPYTSSVAEPQMFFRLKN